MLRASGWARTKARNVTQRRGWGSTDG
jgi:hypothetical protein